MIEEDLASVVDALNRVADVMEAAIEREPILADVGVTVEVTFGDDPLVEKIVFDVRRVKIGGRDD